MEIKYTIFLFLLTVGVFGALYIIFDTFVDVHKAADIAIECIPYAQSICSQHHYDFLSVKPYVITGDTTKNTYALRCLDNGIIVDYDIYCPGAD